MTRACLGLGGNIGDPRASMSAALRAIDARADCDVSAVSRLFETPPWGVLEQPRFLNACAVVNTRLDARAMLELCLAVERELKRERNERWGPRTIDVDLLDFDGRTLAADGLILPHPRMLQRAFVLVPLADIAPDVVIAGRPVADWAAAVDATGIEPVSADGRWWRVEAGG
ncbi:2-amino-4-hydroxy-6-hydroxymethyldihydropteridine diphosphokinase [Mangrovibrevibacter kandeliae]|uniref:2-amino-4-hydroxy-6- hydroxymethyldihydropteridine diphosphokinase n=1 Tax=Mangrovibrevibacter kandeliae TaxID=2968473 RepID=UPI00389AAEB8